MLECFNDIVEKFNIGIDLEDDGGNLCLTFNTNRFNNEFYIHL